MVSRIALPAQAVTLTPAAPIPLEHANDSIVPQHPTVSGRLAGFLSNHADNDADNLLLGTSDIVPEPGRALLMAFGLSPLGFRRRRRCAF